MPRRHNLAATRCSGYTVSMKTAISIPDALFSDADRAAKRLRVSRSEFYRRALAAFLHQQQPPTVTEQLDAFYAAHAELNGLDAGWETAQAEVMGRDPW